MTPDPTRDRTGAATHSSSRSDEVFTLTLREVTSLILVASLLEANDIAGRDVDEILAIVYKCKANVEKSSDGTLSFRKRLRVTR